MSLDDSLSLTSTGVATERAEAEYQVTALTYDSNIALDGKDAHFNIQVLLVCTGFVVTLVESGGWAAWVNGKR